MTGTSATPATPGDPRPGDGAALLELTELGEYFALEVLEQPAVAGLSLDDATVAAMVHRTRDAIASSMKCALGEIPVRMAASSLHLDLVARLISPVIGAATSLGVVPMLVPDTVRWQPTPRHVPQFGTTGLRWVDVSGPSDAASSISDSVLATIVVPLNRTFRSTFSLSHQITWGNAISAANGAVTVMAITRPELQAPGRALIRALLNTEYIEGTGEFVGDQFVRRSCCLFYQAPGAGFCGDCVLA